MEKGAKDPFWIYEVKKQHHAYKFDNQSLEAIMYLVESKETNVEP